MADAVTYSVTLIARTIGKNPQTVRGWTKRYSKYLSKSATVDAGQERRYTEDDVALLQTVAYLVNQGQKHKDIPPLLDSGFKIPDETDKPESAPDTETTAIAPVDILERFVVRYEARIDELEAKLTVSDDARRLAEVDAARLVGQLDSVYRRHWWQIWRPERPQDED
jgi:DNA-binding transcriptional MerR regulator